MKTSALIFISPQAGKHVPRKLILCLISISKKRRVFVDPILRREAGVIAENVMIISTCTLYIEVLSIYKHTTKTVYSDGKLSSVI